MSFRVAHEFPASNLPASLGSALTSDLFKGIGYAQGKSRPEGDIDKLAPEMAKFQTAMRESVRKSLAAPQNVVKGLAPEFASAMSVALGGLQADVQKDITLTSPLATGFVPFDLVAPARLVYPVFSPLRNKLPRVPGQGTSRRAKIITSIAGSGTGTAAARVAVSELNGGTLGSNWPLNLPASLGHSATDMSVPYKFFGLSESISWLAQFAGQGFEDIAGLANLLMLQKAMLAEEYEILFDASSAVAQPAKPTLAARSAGSGETALSGVSTNLYVLVTAVTPFGETAYGSSLVANVAPTTGQVVDVTIAPVAGATQYNVYVGTGASAPASAAGYFLQGSTGGVKFTVQGALATSGQNPPAADTGTGNASSFDGMFAILSGKAAGGSYPAGTVAGYYAPATGKKASIAVFNAALYALWQKTKADPAEIVMEGSDVARLSDDIRANSAQAYRLFIAQSELANVMAGTAVASFVNPVTRREIPILVHPWLPQGNALVLSYTIPFPYTNISNIWENVMVQDYLSVQWPRIDMSFRYSIFWYGALVCYAPIYMGLVQGLQVSDTAPYS